MSDIDATRKYIADRLKRITPIASYKPDSGELTVKQFGRSMKYNFQTGRSIGRSGKIR